MEGRELLIKAKEIAGQVRIGVLSYEEGKVQAEPLLVEYNQKAREISKKYKRKWYDLSYTKLLRLY